jgi:hypothetical protein
MATGQQFLFAPEKPLVTRLGTQFFRRIPTQPGVYKMRDASNAIVYVGKAKNLRQRLRSYRVANPERLGRRHLRLLQQVTRIEFDLCSSENAALQHEAKLIRELKPKFNRAGTWAGRAQFLTWRFTGSRIELAVHEIPPVGWERAGSYGAYARRLQATLAQLLWLAAHPQLGFRGLPHGWARGEMAEVAAVECGELAEGVRTALANAFWGEAGLFFNWLALQFSSDVPAFEKAAVAAAVAELEEFFGRMEPDRRSAQMALL